MLTVLIVLACLSLLFVFLVDGRRGHPGLSELRGWRYAHRGLHGNGIPENSLAAFRAAKEAGFGVELDVHLMGDGNLAVIHDASLERTAGASVRIEDLSAEALCRYPLQGTDQTIPLFSQVLELYRGAAPIIIELKCVDNNYNALCSAVCEALHGYDGAYCLESFDPRCVAWLKKNRPDLIRGQLTQNFFHTGSKLPWYLIFALRHQLLNVFTRPDFVAYRFAERKTISNLVVRKLLGIQGVSWTLRTREEYETAVEEGWIPIFEGFIP